MDLLVVVVIALLSVIGSLVKKKEQGKGGTVVTTRPRPVPPIVPNQPWLFAPPVIEEEGEGVSLEESTLSAGEGEGFGSPEESSLAGEGPPETEALVGQVEINRERLAFRAETMDLTKAAGESTVPTPPMEDEFRLEWDEVEDDEGRPRRAAPMSARGLLDGRDDLVRGVLAAEILGRPGGRWANHPNGPRPPRYGRPF